MKIMHDMELDDEDKLDAMMPIAMSKKPDYPFGLRISLSEKELEKLGVDPAEAYVGGTVHLFAMAEITSVSKTEDGNGDCCRVEMQIQKLGVESEDEENEHSTGEHDGSQD